MTDTIVLYPLAPLLFLAGAGVFVLRMARHLRVFAAVRPAPSPAPLRDALDAVVRFGLIQVRLFRDPSAGILHALIFWGFVLLTIGTLDRVGFGLVHGVLSAPLDGAIWNLVLALQAAMSVAVLVGIGWALFRRLVIRPERLTLSRDGLLILGMIGGVVLTETLAEVFRVALTPGDERTWSWLAGGVVGATGGIPAELATTGYRVFFWLNVALVSLFLAYLPGSKHLHIVTALPNIALRKPVPRTALPVLDLDAEGTRFGVRTVADLTRKDLLDGFTCTECGRCLDACPAAATGKPLDPKALVMGIRDLAVEAEADLPLVPWIRPVAERGTPEIERPIVGAAIPESAVWDCVTCGACVAACPVLIEHVDKIVGLRRDLVLEQGRLPAALNAPLTAMERHGNPWGQPASERLAWTRGLPFAVPTAAEVAASGPDAIDALEVIYWVGCAAAFDDRNRKVARAFVTCLDAAGVRFAVLGQEETCTGDPARRMGNEYVWRILAEGNVATLERYRPKTIVTACPHCFTALGTDYAALGARFTVVHHSAFLARLVEEGRLRTAPDAPGAGSLTYHDSCYLARYQGVIAEPRAVLAALPGAELREMERSKEGTFCCGAGGGRMWMEETTGTRINAERSRQARETGAGTVATACPFCLVMLRDGLAGGPAGGPEARDVAELLAAALPPGSGAGRALPVLQ